MHKYITLFFSVLLILSACKHGKTSDEIIGQKEMTGLLTDIHIVDGTMYAVMPNPDSLYKYGTGKYLALFKKHNTDSVQFKKSLRYYAGQPVELLAIYDQVLKNIKTKLDSLNAIQTATFRKKRLPEQDKKYPGSRFS